MYRKKVDPEEEFLKSRKNLAGIVNNTAYHGRKAVKAEDIILEEGGLISEESLRRMFPNYKRTLRLRHAKGDMVLVHLAAGEFSRNS